MGGLHYDVTFSTRQAVQNLRDIEQGVRNVATTAEEASGNIDNAAEAISAAFKKIATTVATAFTIDKAIEFAQACIDVRSQIEGIEISLSTLLGNEDAASGMLNQLRQFAAETPMDLQTLASAAQTMLGFGIDSAKVVPTLKAIGDIAMGDAQKFQSLSLAFSQATATGKLMGQDFLQMVNAGFNPLVEMSAKTGKSIKELKEDMSAGSISAEMLSDAFLSASAEGGRFNGMLQAQSEGIAGAYAQLKGSITDFMNDVGGQMQGIVVAGYNATASLVKNYKAIGEALMFAAAGYGMYKAALMTSAVIELGAMGRAVALTLGMNKLTAAVSRLNVALNANAWGIFATAATAVVYGIYKLVTAETDAEQAAKKLEEASARNEKAIAKETLEIDRLFNALGKAEVGSNKYNDTKAKIYANYGHWLKNLGDEKTALNDVAKAYEYVTKKAKEAAQARALESYMQTENDSYAERMGIIRQKTYELLKERMGEEYADNNFDDIVDILEGRKEADKELLDKFEEVVSRAGGSASANTSYTQNLLSAYIGQAQEARKANEEAIKKAETKFGMAKEEEQSAEGSQDVKRNREYWENQKKEAQAALDALSDVELKSEEAAKLRARIAEANARLEGYNVKAGGSSTTKEADKRKEAERKLGEELAEMQQENDATYIAMMKDGTEKKLKQIDNDYTARENAIAKREAELKKTNKEAGKGNTLDAEQQAAIDEARRLSNEQRIKETADVYKAEFEQMRANLAEYGNYQQQKLAIAQEYAEKIRNASSDAERQQLERQRDSNLAQVKGAEFKEGMNWEVLFGEFGNMFKDVVAPVLRDAKAYTKTDEFKNADAQTQTTILEAIRTMEQSMGGGDNVSFNKLGEDIDAYTRSLNNLKVAQTDYERRVNELDSAQQAYLNAVKTGTKEEQKAAKDALTIAQNNVATATANMNAMQTAADTAKNTMTNTATTLKSAVEGVTNGLQQLKSGSLSGVYDGLITLGNSASKMGGVVGKAFGKLADSLQSTPILGAIAGILDILKDGISDLIGSLIDTILGAIGSIIKDVLSLNLVKTIGTSIFEGVTNILDGLSFGLFNSKGNSKEVKENIAAYERANARLVASMDDLKDTIKQSRGMDSVKAYQEAIRAQEAQSANKLGIAQEQARYHAAHRSWNATHRGFTDAELAEIRKTIGVEDFMGDIFTLTPEQMEKFKNYLPDIWHDFFYSGSSDNYADRLLEKIDDYIEDSGKIEELREQFTEAMTGISFDSMYQNFITNLANMEYKASDAADDIAEMFYKAMLSNKIGELYYEKLESWYEQWADATADGMTDKEMAQLQKDYQAIVEEAIAQRDAIAAATGYDKIASKTTQEASSGGFQSMSEDTGEELNGRFTAFAISNQNIADSMVNTIASLQSLSVLANDRNSMLQDMLAQAVAGNEYLADIAKQTKPLLKLNENLDKLIKNTQYA